MEDNVEEKIILPHHFENADTDDLVILIVDMLDRLIVHNDNIPLSPETLTRFHSRTSPGISLLDYLRRIVKYTKTERACLLITLYYIDQICLRTPTFIISSLTVHRFVITCIAISSKAFCDAFCTNTHYAKVGGIRVAELNLLEKEFLSQIEWRLSCTRELLQTYYANLIRTHSDSKYCLMGPLDPPPQLIASDLEVEIEVEQDSGVSTGSNSQPQSPSAPSPVDDDEDGSMEEASSVTASPNDDQLHHMTASSSTQDAVPQASTSQSTPSSGPVTRTNAVASSSRPSHPLLLPTLEQNLAFALVSDGPEAGGSSSRGKRTSISAFLPEDTLPHSRPPIRRRLQEDIPGS